MLFRRERIRKETFDDFAKRVQEAGFRSTKQADGHLRIERDGIAAVIGDDAGKPRVFARAGVLLNGEIAALVDGGFQKFFQTASGERKPALAPDLRAVHAFQEDLREALGLTSLYNESLGSVSNLYLYDRVKDRDTARPKRPWELAIRGSSKEPHS